MILPPLASTLFPYTTLFRSWGFPMGKHRTIKDSPSSSDEAAVLPTPASEPDAVVTPKMALAGVDPSKVEMPKTDTVNASRDRKSTRLNSSHLGISYAVFCLK